MVMLHAFCSEKCVRAALDRAAGAGAEAAEPFEDPEVTAAREAELDRRELEDAAKRFGVPRSVASAKAASKGPLKSTLGELLASKRKAAVDG